MASVKVEKELGQAVEKAISFNMAISAVIWRDSKCIHALHVTSKETFMDPF